MQGVVLFGVTNLVVDSFSGSSKSLDQHGGPEEYSYYGQPHGLACANGNYVTVACTWPRNASLKIRSAHSLYQSLAAGLMQHDEQELIMACSTFKQGQP